ncbi:SDR family NAD(P)-dependent oxidoreductase [Shewanella donghaensis]|uniref:SDR family NAD(P)-dependent oxidoreductase n=1 Tax=Shewanella donghaensis TaxID=238836 RepID=UPI001183A72E|nr:SDR family NAD(P)-dependent oxidoreductase [Shewanella donghaensis]
MSSSISSKKILITGATDGIGYETAKVLVLEGHHVLIHGRNPDKLAQVKSQLIPLNSSVKIETYVADLSNLSEVFTLANSIKQQHSQLDVLINNAGVYSTAQNRTADGIDVRFVVNTVAPYLLSLQLVDILGSEGRVVNLSSAAQSSVDINALVGDKTLKDQMAYAQSKLALTMWSRYLGLKLKGAGPIFIAVNPASMLGSKMVKDAYGVAGGDLSIGADILVRAALSAEFADATGKYFDNDVRRFSSPHPEALKDDKVAKVIQTLDGIIAKIN